MAEQDDAVVLGRGQDVEYGQRRPLLVRAADAVDRLPVDAGRQVVELRLGRVHEAAQEFLRQFHGRRVGTYGLGDEDVPQLEDRVFVLFAERGEDLQVQAAVALADAGRVLLAGRLELRRGGRGLPLPHDDGDVSPTRSIWVIGPSVATPPPTGTPCGA